MEKLVLTCDICRKQIKDGNETRYMFTLKMAYPHAYNDGGSCAAVNRESQIFHLHFDCASKVLKAYPRLVPAGLL